MKIYFIRHGETPWNKEKRLQGRSDIPLNEYGKELAQITAQALKNIPFDVIYSSPLLRAKETAQILAEGRNLPILEDPRLLEMSFGEGEGESLLEIYTHPELKLYNFIHNPATYTPPNGGESFEDVYNRCKSFIEDVLVPAETKYDCILVVAHGALIRGMIHCINHRPTKDFWSITHKNCSVTIADCTHGHLSIETEGVIYYQEDIEATW